MTQTNFYHVLGIPAHASEAEVRAAYVRLVKLHHPDVDGDLPAGLNALQQAYRGLSDATSRAAHDRAIAEREQDHRSRQQRVVRRLRSYDRRHPHDLAHHAGARRRPSPKLMLLLVVPIAACVWYLLA